MKKILILGCSGFIGKNLATYFSKKKNTQVHGTYLTRKPKIRNIKLYKLNILGSVILKNVQVSILKNSSHTLKRAST